MAQITLFIVEDHEITRLGLKVALERIHDFQVVGEAGDGESALSQILALKPKVVVMDVGLPKLDGIDVTRQIKVSCPDTSVIVLTSHDSDREIFAAFSAGADGYCLKGIPISRLELAIKSVSEGGAWLDPSIASRVLSAWVQSSPPAPLDASASQKNESSLSERELAVLSLLVEGLTNQQIADRLYLSLDTVKTHIRHIMEKLSVSDRTQAAVKALRQGIVS